MRKILIITALADEAHPLTAALKLKPLRENIIGERFQVFFRDQFYLAVSGIGKLRAAVTTSALLSALFSDAPAAPLVANIGIAGTSCNQLPIGAPVYINQIFDATTNGTLYPDIIFKHGLRELALETHEHPVTTPPKKPVLVDMEGYGFAQAALTFVAPSNISLIKVVSDYCQGLRLSKDECRELITANVESITKTLVELSAALPEVTPLNHAEQELFQAVVSYAGLTLTQRIELSRQLSALKSRAISITEPLNAILNLKISTKDERNRAYQGLLSTLTEAFELTTLKG